MKETFLASKLVWESLSLPFCFYLLVFHTVDFIVLTHKTNCVDPHPVIKVDCLGLQK